MAHGTPRTGRYVGHDGGGTVVVVVGVGVEVVDGVEVGVAVVVGDVVDAVVVASPPASVASVPT